MSTPSENYVADIHLVKRKRLQNKVFRKTDNFKGVQLFEICMWLSKLRTCMFLSQNYASSKQEPNRAMKIKILATLNKAKPRSETISGLNLTGVHFYDSYTDSAVVIRVYNTT